MGLVKEPKNVDFYVIDKLWSEREKKELSKYIAGRKAESKKSGSTAAGKKMLQKL